MSTAINIVAMQCAWFACVLGAANGIGWIGTLASIAVAALHLVRAEQRRLELTLLLAALAIGMLLDSTLASARLLTFASGEWIDGFTTHWMLGLWIGFATTLTTTLRWVLDDYPRAIAFGALGGPLAYWSGEKLGALTLAPGAGTLIAIGLGWAIAMTLFAYLVKRPGVPAEALA